MYKKKKSAYYLADISVPVIVINIIIFMFSVLLQAYASRVCTYKNRTKKKQPLILHFKVC